jgi:hypothetical protein
MLYNKGEGCLVKEALLCYIKKENEHTKNIELFKREYYNQQIEE